MMDQPNEPQKESLSELDVCKQQAEEYLSNWKRERADFINYKKDELKRLGEIIKFGNEALILEIIEILDDLEIAAKEISELEPILKKMRVFLKKHEIEKIEIDDKFNPVFHDAVETEEGGENLEEIRAGYTMHGKVIRPARVRIKK